MYMNNFSRSNKHGKNTGMQVITVSLLLYEYEKIPKCI